MSDETLPDSASANARHKRPETCCLCFRDTALTFHHLIPRKVHRRSFFQKNYSREQLNLGIFICRTCHKGIHALFDEMTLARQYNTLEQLREDAELAKHVAWSAKQKTA
jgi:hypothetical protein